MTKTWMYELTYIINPLLGKIDLNATADKIRGFINESGGQIKQEKLEEKRKLAYPIKKQLYGYYVSVDFNLEPEKIDELQKVVADNSDVLRHCLINRDEKSLTASITPPKRRPIRPSTVSAPAAKTKKEEKVKIEELDKKLDEILEG